MYVYVNSAQKEFDYPRGDENAYATYTGQGASDRRRLKGCCLQSASTGCASSHRAISTRTRIIFRRQLGAVEAAAPFLEFDSDPYAGDGRLHFVDAYTTSRTFPYSEGLRSGLIISELRRVTVTA